MVTLAMDTAYKNLTTAVYEDGKVLAGFSEENFKKQSENLFPKLEMVLEQAGKKLKDVDEIVISQGPGSYTGLRIAMAAAKVIATQSPCRLSVINTMQLYAGKKNANVILDARGHRAYAAHIEDGKTVWMGILDLDDIPGFLQEYPGELVGDGYLIGQDTNSPDFVQNFLDLADVYEPVENIHMLTPLYLKESDSYKV